MKLAKVATVQKGSELPNLTAVKKRLLEIRDNPKSKYHKHLLRGEIEVHRDPLRRTRGQYDIRVVEPEQFDGLTPCGNCENSFFDIDGDYLCPSCRE